MLTNRITTEPATDTWHHGLPAVIFHDLEVATDQVRVQPGLFQSATVGAVTLTLQPGRASDGAQTLDGNLRIDLHDPELSSLEFRLLDESETRQVEGEVSPLGTFRIVFRSVPTSSLRIKFSDGVHEETNDFWAHFAAELAKASAQLEAGGPPLKIPAISPAELERVHGQAVRVKSRVLGAASGGTRSLPDEFYGSQLDAGWIVCRMPRRDQAESYAVKVIAQDTNGLLIGSCRMELKRKLSMKDPNGYWFGQVTADKLLSEKWLGRPQDLHFYCVPEDALPSANPK